MLKREELTSERIDQIVADAHAAGYHFFLSSEAREASLKKTLTRYQPGEEVWVFAYGSLMWNPAIEFTEATPCAIEGWRRSFCFWVPLGRGTPELPGLMLALDQGGACRGIAYRIEGPDMHGKLAGVWRREMRARGYLARTVRAETAAGPVKALAFVANRGGERYAGRLTEAEIAGYIAQACGQSGPSAEYLLETVARCEELGIRDPGLWRLQRLVAGHLAAGHLVDRG